MTNFPYHKFSTNRTKEQAVQLFEQRIRDAISIFEKYSADFVSRPCPVCGSLHHREGEAFYNKYKISVCLSCRTQYVNPVPSKAALAEYYLQSGTGSLANEILRKRAESLDVFQDVRIQKIMNLLSQTTDSKSYKLLEVGCNSGGFLYKLDLALSRQSRGKNIELMGIDIDSTATSNPVAENLDLQCADAEVFASDFPGQFDIICFFELIEHLPHPFEFMRSIHRMLKPGGIVLFTTPNGLGFENLALGYNAFRPIAHAVFPPMHLNAFTTQNVMHFALRSGFWVNEIETPGLLDVDLVFQFLEPVPGPLFQHLGKLSDEDKGFLQAVLRETCASSHMLVSLTRGE